MQWHAPQSQLLRRLEAGELFEPRSWKTDWECLKKVNIGFLYDPAILLLGVSPRDLKTYVYIKTYTQMFRAALFIIPKKWKQPKCSAAEWMNKMLCIHIIEYLLFSYKKEWSTDACNNIDKP